MQLRIMAAVRTRGTTIAGLGREALAGRAIRQSRDAQRRRRSGAGADQLGVALCHELGCDAGAVPAVTKVLADRLARNINDGVALFPMQLLFCKFFVVVTVVIGFIVDVSDPGVMQRPPRKPGTRIVNRPQIIRWLLSGLVVAVTALLVLDLGPDEPSTTHASVSMTMAFAVVAFTAVNLGFVMRREREAPWSSPLFPYMGWIILGWVLTWAGVELHMFQRLLDTESLTGGQWAIVLGLSLIAPALVWADKAIQLRRQQKAAS
jgi:P-type Ca2+ transporter type 2C